MKAQQSRNNHATMKKTKKITNLHDYSKEVDRIIALGKPIHEQLIDLLEMVGGKVVDVSSNKHDKSVQDNQIKKTMKSPRNDTSDCCGADVLTVSGYPKDEGTHYWQCSKCGKPCNIMSRGGSQTKRKRDAPTGSTAKVHLKNLLKI